MNQRRKDLVQKFAALGSLLVLMIAFSFTSDAFFSVGNGMTVALQVTSIAYLGIGATCVIITGGIDLSVGSILALSGVVAALAVKAGVPVPLAMLLGLLTGAAVRPGQRLLHRAPAAAALHRDARDDAGRARPGVAGDRREGDRRAG
jgi:ribose/xylose/arabinose/galactoside ABC-type transport system permease subunit